jgi:predicted  nucleic acid-binding Zn-ribbon protein
MAALGSRGDLGQRLLQLKAQLEEKRNSRAELQGELKSLNKQLFEEFGVKNLQEAESLIAKQEKKIQKMEQEIRDEIEEIERMMKNG